MKNWKLLVTPLCLAAATLMAPTGHAQTVAIFAGSSGGFSSVGVAGATPDPINGNPATCGVNVWSAKSSEAWAGEGKDTRNVAYPGEKGNIWVEWSSEPLTAASTVCAYLSVDSVVGNRLFFGTVAGGGHATLAFAANPTLEPGDGLLAPFLVDQPLPADVFAALTGQQVTAAMSDIRPEDAEYATQRAILPCAGGNCLTDHLKNGEGYGGPGAGNPGLAVLSAFSGSSAQVIEYNITGSDPVTGVAVPGAQTIDIGAYPVVFFYNNQPTGAGCATDFSAVPPTNIPSHTLALLYSGYLSRTTDVSGATGAACPINVLEREAISGTFNTFEFQGVRNKGTTETQENFVDPSNAAPNNNCAGTPTPGPCGNPFVEIYADGSHRARVIGTGQMVTVADGDTAGGSANAIGYGFWTFATFGAAHANTFLSYVKVDGVDPLQETYTNGAIPVCTAVTEPCRLPFTNLINGGYRIWNIIRMIVTTNPAQDTAANAPTAADVALAEATIAAGQDQSDPVKGNITDFVPFTDANGHVLNVFRSHYAIPGIANLSGGVLGNGTNPAPFAGKPAYYDNGGDMGGAIFYNENDQHYLTDFGAEIWGFVQ